MSRERGCDSHRGRVWIRHDNDGTHFAHCATSSAVFIFFSRRWPPRRTFSACWPPVLSSSSSALALASNPCAIRSKLAESFSFVADAKVRPAGAGAPNVALFCCSRCALMNLPSFACHAFFLAVGGTNATLDGAGAAVAPQWSDTDAHDARSTAAAWACSCIMLAEGAELCALEVAAGAPCMPATAMFILLTSLTAFPNPFFDPSFCKASFSCSCRFRASLSCTSSTRTKLKKSGGNSPPQA